MANFEVSLTVLRNHQVYADVEADSREDAIRKAEDGIYTQTFEKKKEIIDVDVWDIEPIDCTHGFKRGRGCPTCEALEHGNQQYHQAKDDGLL